MAHACQFLVRGRMHTISQARPFLCLHTDIHERPDTAGLGSFHRLLVPLLALRLGHIAHEFLISHLGRVLLKFRPRLREGIFLPTKVAQNLGLHMTQRKGGLIVPIPGGFQLQSFLDPCQRLFPPPFCLFHLGQMFAVLRAEPNPLAHRRIRRNISARPVHFLQCHGRKPDAVVVFEDRAGLLTRKTGQTVLDRLAVMRNKRFIRLRVQNLRHILFDVVAEAVVIALLPLQDLLNRFGGRTPCRLSRFYPSAKKVVPEHAQVAAGIVTFLDLLVATG